jgi:hypothetical protein
MSPVTRLGGVWCLWFFAKDEELDEGEDQDDDGNLAHEKSRESIHAWK